ncbi:MAG: hypothetical protein ACLP9L_03610 [Thermoguttaceae bacterium]
MSVRKLIVLSAGVAMVCGLAGSAMAETINALEVAGNGASGTIGNISAGDPAAVVTAVTSYSSSSAETVIVDDGTGSMELYKGAPAGTVVGDEITATGTYAPYNSIPEVSSPSSFSKVGHTTAPAPVTLTVAQAAAGANSGSLGVLGYVLQINSATIAGAAGATFDGSNATDTITDSSGSTTMYYWESSYPSVKNLPTATPPGLSGLPQNATGVNMVGIVDLYSAGDPEFIPLYEVTTPEPATLIPACAGLALAVGACIRRKFSK